MKNPHGVHPTRFMKREESTCDLLLDSKWGPIFGKGDIFITDYCNKDHSCFINNNGNRGYECHPEYKCSLFVNTNKPNEANYFSVSDYEVFAICNGDQSIIKNICKHPDIIWEYIETKDISEESLKQFDDDIELLNDLDAIHCEDSAIRLKISLYYLKNPSKYLPNTRIVNEQYDVKLREWLGSEYDWRLIYRSSEHGYTARSFHECCDNRGPTLIIIKSDGGWIFGGYTTRSWSGIGIYNDMIGYTTNE